MATCPEPPANPDTAAELVAHVTQHPEDWMFYLRNMDGHAAALEEEITTLRAAARTHGSAISSLYVKVSNRDTIICY